MSDDGHSPGSDSDPDERAEAGSRQLVQSILDNRLSIAEISPSGELFRVIARHNQGRRNAIIANQTERPHGRSTSDHVLVRAAQIAMDRARQNRRRLRNRVRSGQVRDQTGSPTVPAPSTNLATAPPNRQIPSSASSLPEIRRTRSRPAPTIRLLNLANSQGDNESPITRNAVWTLADLDYAGQRLESASSQLRALLDDPIAPIFSRGFSPREHNEETEAGRPTKRRRLDRGRSMQDSKAFKYGHYGQVESGKLNMEIESCDGGIYPAQYGASRFAASNVLLNDDSVYCTKGNRCNLVLRHQGGTPFCLQEVVVKAPPRGYTAPVQEGMIFVAMTTDDLFTRTAQYQIPYTPLSSLRYNDAGSEPPPVVTIRHNSDGSIERDESPFHRIYNRSTSPNNIPSQRVARLPSEFTNASTQSFQVTTICSDDDDNEQNRRPLLSRYLTRSRSTRFEESDEDDDDYAATHPGIPHPLHIESVDTDSSSPPAESAGLADAIEAAQDASQEAVKAVGGSLMEPHARFFIDRDKSKCTIRFDPPVSGRFVLLKMWNPCHDPGGNIDIQSVVVNGFAGPRFFPAVQMR